MHKLHIPAVSRPMRVCQHESKSGYTEIQLYIPQMTLVGPPDVKLRDKLVDKAVHDYPAYQSVQISSASDYEDSLLISYQNLH